MTAWLFVAVSILCASSFVGLLSGPLAFEGAGAHRRRADGRASRSLGYAALNGIVVGGVLGTAALIVAPRDGPATAALVFASGAALTGLATLAVLVVVGRRAAAGPPADDASVARQRRRRLPARVGFALVLLAYGPAWFPGALHALRGTPEAGPDGLVDALMLGGFLALVLNGLGFVVSAFSVPGPREERPTGVVVCTMILALLGALGSLVLIVVPPVLAGVVRGLAAVH